MALSRKHYQQVAEIVSTEIRHSHSEAERKVAENIARDLAHFFKTDNSRFDKEKFYEAAGLYLPLEDLR